MRSCNGRPGKHYMMPGAQTVDSTYCSNCGCCYVHCKCGIFAFVGASRKPTEEHSKGDSR